MAKKLYDESNISAIASAIRNKKSNSETYKVSEMPAAINSITVGDGRCPRSEDGGINNYLKDNTISWYSDLQKYSVPFEGMAYIESSGTQHINTGYIPNANTKVVMSCNITNTGRWATPFGSRDTGDKNRFFLYARKNNSAIFEAGYGSSVTDMDSPFYGYNITIIMCKQYLKLQYGNITEKQILLSNSGAPSETTPLYLFQLGEGSGVYGADTACYMKLYECSIYEGETLVHHYLPAKDENEVACLYDTVEETYLYNAGTGDFTYVEASE